MKLSRRQILHLAAGATAIEAIPAVAWAQTYPMRPVRALVPFPAGGLTDSFARLMVQKLSEHLGKQLHRRCQWQHRYGPSRKDRT